MTLEEFWVLRNTVESNLNKQLSIAKLNTKGTIRPILLDTEHKSFSVYNDDKQGQVLEELLAFSKAVNGTISYYVHDDGKGRVGYYSHTTYSVRYTKLREKITERVVKDSVHKALRNLMGLSSYATIDCKLMQLYKDGKLTWDSLVDAHKTKYSF